MKKWFSLLFMVLLTMTTSSLLAQTNSTTVADGTSTSSYIPIHGLYLNTYCRSQVIYPADLLTDMVGGTITSIDFYTSATAMNYEWPDTMQQQFSLGVTTATSIPYPADYLTDTTTPVYTGTLTISSGVMSIVFDNPYTYNGGNLLLDISTLVRGRYKSVTFLGVTTSEYVSVKGYYGGGVSGITNQIRYMFLPKTTFSYTGGSSCLSPNGATVTNLTETSAVLNIQPRPGQTAWQYLLLPAGSDTTGQLWVSTTDTTVGLTPLTENTAYSVYVRTDCGEEKSFAHQVNFRTPCASLTELPITWDFETDNAGGTISSPMPACWLRTSGNYPKTYVYGSEYAHSGTTVLWYTSAFANGVGATAEIDTTVLPINQLQVEFYARMRTGYTSATVEVGVLGDPNDESTFQVYATFPINSTGYPAEPYRVMFNEFEGWGNRIGFRATNPSSTIVDLYIDDVTISEIPPCPQVQNPSLVYATDSSLSLTWNGLNDSYVVRYRHVADTLWTAAITNTDTILLSGLYPNAEYVIEIAPNCDSITEEMFVQMTAWTACGTISVPYYIDFEDETIYHCWNVLQKGVIEDPYLGDSYFPSVETSISNAHSGTKYVELGAQGGSVAVVAAPKLSQNIETLRLQFYAKEPQAYFSANILGTLQLGLMTDPNDISTFVVLDTLVVSGTTYTLHTINFNQYAFTGPDYNIAFRYIGAGVDTDNVSGIYVDDITITVNASCDEPNNMVVSNITTTSADFSWNGNAESYKLYYQIVGLSTYESVTVPVGDNTVTVYGLQPSTHYYYYVAAVCDDDTEAPSLIGTFMTECGVHTLFPYQETFDNYANGELPDCWQRLPGATESGYEFPFTLMDNLYAHYSSSTPTCLVFNSLYTQPATAILPLFSLNLSALRLTFNARPENSSSGILRVGYMTDPMDSTTFVPHFSIVSSDFVEYSYQSYLVDFNDANAPDGSYIAFRYESGNEYLFFVDDVTVDLIPGCAAPIQLTSSEITNTSANLSWYSSADELILYYKAVSDDEYTEVDLLVDSVSAFLLTGLNPSTTYIWYLSIVCEGNVYESQTATFKTECAGITSVPVTWGFESGNGSGTSANPLPNCWHRINATYPYVYHSTLNNYAHTGSRSLLFNPAGGNLYATITPVDPDALALDTLELCFYARLYFSTTPYTFEVGVMDDPMDVNTFVPVQSITLTDSLYGTSPFCVNFHNYTGSGNYIAFRCVPAVSVTFYMDDVTLQPEVAVEPCETPTGLEVVSIHNESIDVAWDADADVDSWNLHYRTQGGEWSTVTTTTNSYTIAGLAGLTTYEIQVQANCGNDNLSEWSASVTATTTNVGIEEYLIGNLSLYPNPADEYVLVECRMQQEDCRILEVQLLDVYGKLITTITGTNQDASLQTRINVSRMSGGVYFVRVTTDQGTLTKPFVKR